MDKRSRLDYYLVISIFVISVAGIVTLYSQEHLLEGSVRWFRQLIVFLFTFPMIFFIRKLNYRYIGDFAIHFYLFTILLLLLTLVPFIGSSIKGARSWIRFGPMGIQTSELAKLSTIILLAKYLELKEREMDRIPTLLMAFAIACLPMLLIVVQPDFGSAFIFAPILLSMLFLAGADIYHISSVVIFFGVSIFIPLYIEYHRIILVEPLLAHLSELGKVNLLPAVRILKADIWKFVSDATIPGYVRVESDRSYLKEVADNVELFDTLRSATVDVRTDAGGFFLQVLENQNFLIILGLVFLLISISLFAFRIIQGSSFEKLRKYYIPLGVMGISLIAAITVHLTFSFKHYQVVRVTAFINPEMFSRDEAYHIRASKAAIGSGELYGHGIFKGDMTTGARPLVPESSTDFIFSSWCERTGFIGSILILLFLVLLSLRSLLISFDARDRFGTILASGLGFMYFYHTIFNTGIALGLLPVTGLPLSFMSYGGSHMLVCMLAAGILLSVHSRRFAN